MYKLKKKLELTNVKTPLFLVILLAIALVLTGCPWAPEEAAPDETDTEQEESEEDGEETTTASTTTEQGAVIGFVSGQVQSAIGSTLLQGATVTLHTDPLSEDLEDGATATAQSLAAQGITKEFPTDADGYYGFENLNPGDYTVTYKLSGYTTVTETFHIPTWLELTQTGMDGFALEAQLSDGGTNGDTGTFAQITEISTIGDNFYITVGQDGTLYPLTAGFIGSVQRRRVDTAYVPASGLTVQAVFTDTSIAGRQKTTTTDGNGDFSFTGLPAGATVNIGYADYSDGAHFYPTSGNGLLAATVLQNGVILDDGQTNINYTTTRAPVVLSTNLSDNFAVDSNIEVKFSQPIEYYEVTLTDADLTTVEVVTSIDGTDPAKLIINPVNPLKREMVYTLTYEYVIALDVPDPTNNTKWGTINAEDTTGLTFTTQGLTTDISAEQVQNFAIDFDTMGTGWTANWNTTAITFEWDNLTGADHYTIWAYDDGDNDEPVRLAKVTDVDYLTTQSQEVTLPARFDYYRDDAWRTPFLFGTEVSYYITAHNAAYDSQDSDTVALTDETDPAGTISGYTTGDADNSAGPTDVTLTLTFALTGAEYFKTATPSVQDNDPQNSEDAPTPAVNAAQNEATITLIVPAGEDMTGDIIQVNVTDTSDNASTVSLTLN